MRAWLVVVLAAWSSGAGATNTLRPVVTNDGSYGETFTFVADLEDGTYVQLSLAFTNLGPGSIKAICRAVVVPPTGAPWTASKRVGGDDWSYSEGDAERLRIDACAAEVQGERTRVEVPLDGGLVRLGFFARATRRSPPDAFFGTPEQHYRAEILLYRTQVEASVQLPGAAARHLKGAGYVDHTRSTIKPKELADQWVRFRGLRGERGVVLLARRGHDGQITPAWACDPPGHCRQYTRFSLDRTGEGKGSAFRILFPSERYAIRIDSGRLLLRDDPIGDMGLLGKIAAPFFGSPVTYTFRGRFDDGRRPPIEGILEVELADD